MLPKLSVTLLFLAIFWGPRVFATGSCRALFSTELLGLDRADATALRVNALPIEARENWINELLANYRALPKNGDGMFSPRRLADRILALTVRGDRMIQEKLLEGESPRAAFTAYFDRVARPRKAGYQARHVFRVLELVREIFRDSPVVTDGDHLLVGGSFFNGKADLAKSDVDVLGGHRDWIFGFANPARLEQLNAIFKNEGIEAGLKFEFHRISTDHFLGTNQPVVFRIYRDRIELLVYPPAANKHGFYATGGLRPQVVPFD